MHDVRARSRGRRAPCISHAAFTGNSGDFLARPLPFAGDGGRFLAAERSPPMTRPFELVSLLLLAAVAVAICVPILTF